MLKRIILPVIFLVLATGFWVSPDFKEIAAGVAIFLFGMLFLEQGFRSFTGGLLEALLEKTTDKFWKALSFGIVTTTIMQSSSLVSVITISFLSAGLIELVSGIGIIFGANIGTTTGAWLVAGLGLKVNISAYAMPMLVFGIVLVFQSSRTLKGVGYVLAGLGFLFLGIHHMKEGFEAFRETIDLAQFAIPGFLGLVIFTLIGTAATVIMQSSHATLVLIITALAAGQITYENALALAIGANVGTTITAIIGAISANYQGKRLAAAHLIFNVVTGLIAIIFIDQFVLIVRAISEFVGIPNDDYALKLAVFHTVFNLVGVIVMTPLVMRLVTFLEKTIHQPKADEAEPRYLHDAAIDFPDTVMKAVADETAHLYDNAFEIMAHGLSLHRHDIVSDVEMEKVVAKSHKVMDFELDELYETKVKILHAAIVEFISRAQTEIPSPFAHQLFELRKASSQIVQCVKETKHLRKNLNRYINSKNPHMRREYDRIRVQLGEIMRLFDRLENHPEADVDVLDLDDYKVSIEESHMSESTVLDELIRTGAITPTMATSVMNDLGYARRLVWCLVDVGKALYGSADAQERAIEDILSLTEEDVAEIRAEEEAVERK